ncbi:MAG: ribonuclease R [Candidatus Berkiellales bacterium]
MVKKNKQSNEQSSTTDPFLARESQNYENPIPSREFILATLIEWGVPTKRQAIVKHFALTDPDQQEALRRRLKAMMRDGQIIKTPKGYVPITEYDTCNGVIVIVREGEGYLQPEEGGDTIELSGAALRGYYDGDLVEVQITQIDPEGHTQGRIVKLLKGVVPHVVGRLIENTSGFELLPFDRKFSQNIIVTKADKGVAKNGDIAEVEILREEKPRYPHEPIGKVIDILGDFSTPGIEINIALRKFKIPHEWPKAVLEECEKWGNQVNLSLKEERINLTDLNLVTIDGEDAKDFDDAVYCEATKSGGWQLWVAIADVSFYVKPNSALDKEAILRGNSTYFPGSAIPMLPEVLSNGLCSLKPQVPRLTVVCQMSINEKGVILRSKFYRALIRSKARLTYTEVAEIVRGHTSLRKTYEPLLPSLDALHQLYHALYHQRKLRGAIDFDTVETRILFDGLGKIKNIVPQVRNVAHKMIEESMLAANVCAAKFIQRNKRDTLYRVHDQPPKDKLAALREFLSELGLDLTGRQNPQPKDFSHLVERIGHRDDRHMIETVMLRSLSQAQYNPKNSGHFGLAYPVYLHFTSPIRRYPDLIVHRNIVDILTNKKPKQNLQELEKLGGHFSESERRSDEATRDASMALKCHYMQDKLSEHYHGIVSGVTSFGIFVELKDIYVEGLVHVTALGNEYFRFDPAHHRMIGERTRTTYRLGDSVEVKVVRVDVEAKKIDLELLKFPGSYKQKAATPSKKGAQRKSKKKKSWHKPK